MASKLRTVAAGVACFGVVAAGCGGDDGGGATGGSVDANVQSQVQEQLAGNQEAAGEAPEAQPTTMEEWEARWAQERAAIVERIEAEGWGLTADGTKLVGPEGFTVDLAACPAGWSNTEGVTDSEVRFGFSLPMSGQVADLARIYHAVDTIFATYSEQGFFEDSTGKVRQVRTIAKDDAYDPARTIPLVDELVDSERVFSILMVGAPAALQLNDRLNERCIPTFNGNGHPAWGDPVNHPWTFGMNLSYTTEAVIWGAFVESRLEELGGRAKVAALVLDNDSGNTYASAFRAYLDQSAHRDDIEYVTESVALGAPNVKDAMTTLAAENPDIFIVMGVGNMCAQALTEAAENGMNESVEYKFLTGNCKSPSFVGKDAVGGDGSTSDGWWVVGGGLKDLTSAAYDDDPFVAWMREQLAAHGHDYKASANFFWGAYFGWGLTQALKIAGELDGGLTRTNYLLAMRAMDMTHPMLFPGIGFNMNGNADAFLTEGSDVSTWDAAQQRWVQQGAVLEMSGQSSNCTWDEVAKTCS